MEKLISVIIPAYNSEKTIERCIKSIVNRDLEIIVVIDGATDNTLKICEDLKMFNENIKIIEQENMGVLEARNTGIQNASGEYIMFLDSDDTYKENTVDRINELIAKYNKPDLIKFRYEKIPNGYVQYKYTETNEEQILKKDFKLKVYPQFLEGYMLNALWNNCVKREIINKIKLDKNYIKYGEDLLSNLEIFSNINNVVFTNDILYNYIYTENSTTNSRVLDKLLKNLEDAIEVYSMLHEYLVKWDMYNIENVKIVNDRIKKESNQILNIIKQNR